MAAFAAIFYEVLLAKKNKSMFKNPTSRLPILCQPWRHFK